MATRTWSSAASTDMNLTTNYSGSGSFATDDLVFDATSVVNAAATANIECNSITITSGYSGTWALTGYTATMQGFSDDGITGGHNYGNAITCNGASATFHTGGTGSAKTATSCVITLNGTTGMTLDCDTNFLPKALVLAASAVVTYTGAGYIWPGNAASVTPLQIGNNATFTINGAGIILRAGAEGMSLHSIGTGVTLNGTGLFGGYSYTNGVTVYLPGYTYTGSGNNVWQSNSLAATSYIEMTGNINTGTAMFYIGSSSMSYLGKFSTKNYSITCGTLHAYLGEDADFGSSLISCTRVSGSVGNTAAWNMGSSQWTVAGSYQATDGITYTVGTSIVTITDTSTITCNGKTFCNDLILNANTKTITLADALSVDNDFTHTAGNLNQNTKVVTVAGDVVLNSNGTNTYNAAWTIGGNLTWGPTATGTKTGSTFTFANASSFNTVPGGHVYTGPGDISYITGAIVVHEALRAVTPKAVATTFQDPGVF